jgi:hypothetical protein
VAWGRNNCGQSTVPDPNTEFVAATGGAYHSLGLKGYACGDLDFDADIDMDDYALFLAAFGHCVGDAAYSLAADCDHDGCTTLVDYRIWRARYAEYDGAIPGDLNCDGSINFGDINPFVLALTNRSHYLDYFPNCDIYYLEQ